MVNDSLDIPTPGRGTPPHELVRLRRVTMRLPYACRACGADLHGCQTDPFFEDVSSRRRSVISRITVTCPCCGERQRYEGPVDYLEASDVSRHLPCARCGYDLHGLVSYAQTFNGHQYVYQNVQVTCPECGLAQLLADDYRPGASAKAANHPSPSDPRPPTDSSETLLTCQVCHYRYMGPALRACPQCGTRRTGLRQSLPREVRREVWTGSLGAAVLVFVITYAVYCPRLLQSSRRRFEYGSSPTFADLGWVVPYALWLAFVLATVTFLVVLGVGYMLLSSRYGRG